MESITLEGMYDLHVHASPSLAPRKFSALEAIKVASVEEMEGLLFLDHTYNTVSVAHVLNELDFKSKAFGSILLNEAVGGINPSVVEAAVKMGTKQIQMPTYSSQNHKEKYGDDQKIFPYQKKINGIRILDEKGRLISEVHDILDIISGSGSFLGTGHLSAEEIKKLVERAKELKIKVLINSVSTDIVDLPVEIQKELAGENVFMEHDYIVLTDIVRRKTSAEIIMQQIRSVGPENCILATDAGQPQNLDHVQGLKTFIGTLKKEGLKENNIELLLKSNPKRLLGI